MLMLNKRNAHNKYFCRHLLTQHLSDHKNQAILDFCDCYIHHKSAGVDFGQNGAVANAQKYAEAAAPWASPSTLTRPCALYGFAKVCASAFCFISDRQLYQNALQGKYFYEAEVNETKAAVKGLLSL